MARDMLQQGEVGREAGRPTRTRPHVRLQRVHAARQTPPFSHLPWTVASQPDKQISRASHSSPPLAASDQPSPAQQQHGPTPGLDPRAAS
jgi:hypothetical protein